MAKNKTGKRRAARRRSSGGQPRLAASPAQPQGQHNTSVVVVQVDGTGQALVFADDAGGLDQFDLTRLLAAKDLNLPGFSAGAISSELTSAATSLNVSAQATSAAVTLQGLYRLGPQTQALMANGAEFIVSDGVRLGSLVRSGRIVKPVQLVPAGGAGLAGFLAGVGPALVLLGLQLQLGRVTKLVEGLYPLGSRRSQRSALTAGPRSQPPARRCAVTGQRPRGSATPWTRSSRRRTTQGTRSA